MIVWDPAASQDGIGQTQARRIVNGEQRRAA